MQTAMRGTLQPGAPEHLTAAGGWLERLAGESPVRPSYALPWSLDGQVPTWTLRGPSGLVEALVYVSEPVGRRDAATITAVVDPAAVMELLPLAHLADEITALAAKHQSVVARPSRYSRPSLLLRLAGMWPLQPTGNGDALIRVITKAERRAVAGEAVDVEAERAAAIARKGSIRAALEEIRQAGVYDLAGIGEQLRRRNCRGPRGGAKWPPRSVARLLQRLGRSPLPKELRRKAGGFRQ